MNGCMMNMRGRRVRIHRHLLHGGLDAPKRGRQPHWRADDFSTAAVAATPAAVKWPAESTSRERREDDIASNASGFVPSRSLLRPPPKTPQARHLRQHHDGPASVAATVLIRMSRCFTCASSCAMTPSSPAGEADMILR